MPSVNIFVFTNRYVTVKRLRLCHFSPSLFSTVTYFRNLEGDFDIFRRVACDWRKLFCPSSFWSYLMPKWFVITMQENETKIRQWQGGRRFSHDNHTVCVCEFVGKSAFSISAHDLRIVMRERCARFCPCHWEYFISCIILLQVWTNWKIYSWLVSSYVH